ncbi:MAG TPA: thioredoxin domain-containing protein, partial [Sphingomicrobium sp.]
QQFLAIAKIAGLQEWAALRGIPQAKSTQCLTNENSVNQLVQMNSDATTQFPEFQGTPTFVINGQLVKDTATWDKLEPALRSALGERG